MEKGTEDTSNLVQIEEVKCATVILIYIGSVPNSARLTYLSVYDSRDGASVPAPSSLTHVHRIPSHTLPTSILLTFMCTQVLWCLPCLDRPRVSGVTMTTKCEECRILSLSF